MLVLTAPVLLPAQTNLRLSAGATASSNLLAEVIGDNISARPSMPAPTVALAISHRVGTTYRAGVEARVTTGTTEIRDGSIDDDLGTLRTIGILAFLDGPVRGAVRWHAGVGLLRYQPAEEIGLWSAGGTTRPMLGGGLTWSRSLGSVDLVFGARYDIHTFSTDRLASDGFVGSTTVHRGGLTLGLERSF